jgi:hypothetical protein
MTILQVAKIAFFSKHCHFFVVFLSFFEEFSIFFNCLPKLHQNLKNDKKMTDKLKRKKNDKKIKKKMTHETDMTKKTTKK